jgi:hypothetical protein
LQQCLFKVEIPAVYKRNVAFGEQCGNGIPYRRLATPSQDRHGDRTRSAHPGLTVDQNSRSFTGQRRFQNELYRGGNVSSHHIVVYIVARVVDWNAKIIHVRKVTWNAVGAVYHPNDVLTSEKVRVAGGQMVSYEYSGKKLGWLGHGSPFLVYHVVHRKIATAKRERVVYNRGI